MLRAVIWVTGSTRYSNLCDMNRLRQNEQNAGVIKGRAKMSCLFCALGS